jgi:fumarate reductase subunit C
MNEYRPFIRAQPRHWWAHKPYLAYTIRELSGVAVALYGAVLLTGLVCLWRGREAYAVYRHVLASPWSLLVHLVLLAAVLWHVVTWFRILPKTLPKLVLHGRLVSQQRISTVALLLACVCSAALLVAAVMLGAWS